MNHPTPWRVEYTRHDRSWHPRSRATVVDAHGELVAAMPQTVDHPGEYDAIADETAKRIVAAVNSASAEEWFLPEGWFGAIGG
jgi:hypothetical protein